MGRQQTGGKKGNTYRERSNDKIGIYACLPFSPPPPPPVGQYVTHS